MTVIKLRLERCIYSHRGEEGCASSVSVYVRNAKKCMGISKSLNIASLHQVITMSKLRINSNLPQLLCIVVSAAQNG